MVHNEQFQALEAQVKQIDATVKEQAERILNLQVTLEGFNKVVESIEEIISESLDEVSEQAFANMRPQLEQLIVQRIETRLKQHLRNYHK